MSVAASVLCTLCTTTTEDQAETGALLCDAPGVWVEDVPPSQMDFEFYYVALSTGYSFPLPHLRFCCVSRRYRRSAAGLCPDLQRVANDMLLVRFPSPPPLTSGSGGHLVEWRSM